jgi:hypothetical protein
LLGLFINPEDSSRTSINLCQTIQHNIPEDDTLHYIIISVVADVVVIVIIIIIVTFLAVLIIIIIIIKIFLVFLKIHALFWITMQL